MLQALLCPDVDTSVLHQQFISFKLADVSQGRSHLERYLLVVGQPRE